MIVNYDKANTFAIPLENRAKPLVLIPGMNTIDDSLWKDVSQLKSVKKLMEKGHLKIRSLPKEGAESLVINDVSKDPVDLSVHSAATSEKSGFRSSGFPDIANMAVDEAVDVIKNTLDVEGLEMLLQEESRAGVQKAAKAQLKKIEKESKAAAKQT